MIKFFFTCIMVLTMVFNTFSQNSLNYKQDNFFPNTVHYSVFIQSFYDSNDDGIGDIPGLTGKLDYLSDLGVGSIWLLPVHPSPTYHKYDIIDYYNIHKDYGTLTDFKNLVTEAHKRNIKIIIDLVVNHTSSDHAWFKEAIKNPDNPFRDYYVWSKDRAKINKTSWQWHDIKDTINASSMDEKYYGFFWHTMPDLNYNNQKVREEIKKIGKFWLDEMNIDGFRLDAIRFIYPEKQKEKNHAWWQEFRATMDSVKPDFYMVAEVWGEDTIVAPFLNKGVHSSFNFDLSFGIEKILKEEKDSGLIGSLIKTRSLYKSYSDDFVDAIFLKNHDQNRIRSVLNNNIKKSKLAASILFTLPGAPFLYYGEEIGMLGKKPDEFIREPFLWDDQEKGQTSWEIAKYSTFDKVNPLSKQIIDDSSLYNHYKKIIAFRNKSKAIILGEITTTEFTNNSLLSFYRLYGAEKLLVIHNLTNEIIDLSLYDEIADERNILVYPKQLLRHETRIINAINPYQTLVFKHRLH